MKYCRQALELDSEQKLAHYHMGLIYAAKMRWSEAAECLSRALEIDPADPSLSFNLGTICVNAGWLDQAETHFQRAKELDPVCEDPLLPRFCIPASRSARESFESCHTCIMATPNRMHHQKRTFCCVNCTDRSRNPNSIFAEELNVYHLKRNLIVARPARYE